MLKQLLVFISLVGIVAGIQCYELNGLLEDLEFAPKCTGHVCVSVNTNTEIYASCALPGVTCTSPEMERLLDGVRQVSMTSGENGKVQCCHTDLCNDGQGPYLSPPSRASSGRIRLSTFSFSLLPLTLSLVTYIYSMQ